MLLLTCSTYSIPSYLPSSHFLHSLCPIPSSPTNSTILYPHFLLLTPPPLSTLTPLVFSSAHTVPQFLPPFTSSRLLDFVISIFHAFFSVDLDCTCKTTQLLYPPSTPNLTPPQLCPLLFPLHYLHFLYHHLSPITPTLPPTLPPQSLPSI